MNKGILSVIFIIAFSIPAFAEDDVIYLGDQVPKSKKKFEDVKPKTPQRQPIKPDALEFRGIYMGMSVDEVYSTIKKRDEVLQKMEKYLSEQQIKDKVCPSNMYCKDHYNIKGRYTEVLFWFNQNLLTHITISFTPDDYELYRDALMEKYGRPANIEHETKQNLMGVKFNNEIASWTQKGGYITIKRYDSKATEGSMFIGSNDYIKSLSDQTNQNKQAPGF